MNIKSKQFGVIVPGSTMSVKVAGDLGFAMRTWKKKLKENEVIQDTFERKFFTKPSTHKKRQRDIAIYKQGKE